MEVVIEPSMITIAEAFARSRRKSDWKVYWLNTNAYIGVGPRVSDDDGQGWMLDDGRRAKGMVVWWAGQ